MDKATLAVLIENALQDEGVIESRLDEQGYVLLAGYANTERMADKLLKRLNDGQ